MSTVRPTSAREVTLSPKAIRFVKHNLPLVNPCWLFPSTCFIWLVIAPGMIRSITFAGTEVKTEVWLKGDLLEKLNDQCCKKEIRSGAFLYLRAQQTLWPGQISSSLTWSPRLLLRSRTPPVYCSNLRQAPAWGEWTFKVPFFLCWWGRKLTWLTLEIKRSFFNRHSKMRLIYP